MFRKKFFIYFLIVLLTVYPASAAEVSLNRWVLNVTLHDNGLVEEVIQAEFENTGTSPLDGFSFISPVPEVTIDTSQSTGVTVSSEGGMSFNAPNVKQQIVSGKTNIVVNFDKAIEAGKKWNGRISLKAENWAVKEGWDYSINISVEAPQASVSGKGTGVAVSENADIRGQVFFPKSVEVTSVLQTPQQKPYKNLLQNNRIVVTWFTGNLHVGDVIKIKGSFSDVLAKIVETNEKLDTVSARINEAKGKGMEVSESETHLKNAVDYLNQAEASFWKKEGTLAIEFVGYANDELAKAESSLSGKAQVTEEIPPVKKTPFTGAAVVILVLLISCGKKRRIF